MSARDFDGDLRQRTTWSSLELEAAVESYHGVRSTPPFPHEAGARLQARLRWP
jgi:hypothetical protein